MGDDAMHPALVGALVTLLVSYRFILVSHRRPPDWMR